jgi:hypothetical protein
VNVANVPFRRNATQPTPNHMAPSRAAQVWEPQACQIVRMAADA